MQIKSSFINSQLIHSHSFLPNYLKSVLYLFSKTEYETVSLNYPEPQSVRGYTIIGKIYALSEQADVLKILTELPNLLGIVYLFKYLYFYFPRIWYSPFRIIIFQILDEIRLVH